MELQNLAADRHCQPWTGKLFPSNWFCLIICFVSKSNSSTKERRLTDLVSIGPAMLRDFDRLGVKSVAQLAHADPQALYEKLSKLTGQRQDPCVLDTFTCAVAQAQNPRLPAAQTKWWYWSRLRKSAIKRARS